MSNVSLTRFENQIVRINKELNPYFFFGSFSFFCADRAFGSFYERKKRARFSPKKRFFVFYL